MSDSYTILKKRFARLAHLSRIENIMGWDQETYMPRGASEGRAADLAELSLMQHELLTADDMPDLLASAQPTTEWDKANLACMARQIHFARAVPADLEHAYSEATSRCSTAWLEAKQKSDYGLVRPTFEVRIPLLRQRLDAYASVLNCSRYDAALDFCAPGTRSADIVPVFDQLRHDLPQLMKQILSVQDKRPALAPLEGSFPQARQKEFAQMVLTRMGFDFNHGRMDLSEHPFSAGARDDSRLTGRFIENDPLWSLAAFMHEAGHGLYDQGTPADWALQPVGAALGLALHESQSLFWEKQVGQSLPFITWLSAQMKTTYNSTSPDFAPDALWHRINHVAPSYIRFEADEVTYPLHIILRMELEQALLSGDLPVADLPSAWAEKIKQLLDLPAPSDKQGCVQDPHWYGGWFGYFPDYSLGAIMAAQMMQKMRQDLGNVDQLMEGGTLSPLLGWLRQHVHQRGSSTTADVILKDASGQNLSANTFMSYLKSKYLPD